MKLRLNHILPIAFAIILISCYTPYGAQTSGAKTFSVEYFKPQTPLASPIVAQNFTEELRDLIQRQSTLQLIDTKGELRFEGSITDYRVSPVGVSDGETASRNRLTVTVKVKYTNTLEPDLSFERNFTRFADYESSQDLLTVEEQLTGEINEQLTQEIFNASLGNW
ncbi:MAG: LPS assembly lipoprotein LptE [Flavobacteriales bacterium]|nr:LPS assembly lipoprotein LptE [Flavobacteriales bacterium]